MPVENVVFITIDSLRADYVHGSNAVESLETLNRLKREGAYFNQAFSNAAYTKASFLSLMSGTFPWMFESVQGGYGPNRPHVAQLFSEAGYTTGGFHTNTYLSPTYNYDRGFDYYLGRDRDADGERADISGPEQWFRSLLEEALATKGISDVIQKVYRTAGRHLGIQLGSQLYRPAEQLNDAALSWIERTSGKRFIWLHYMDVHTPYYPHEGTVSEGLSRKRAVKLFQKANELRDDTPQEDIDVLERLYRGEIQYLDRQLGDLFDRLDETLGLENTLVALTSDHGEAFKEHGSVFHEGNQLYDENVHIPLLLLGPNVRNGEVTTPVSNADLVPTLLSAADIEIPAPVVGQDLVPLITDPPAERLVFAEAWDREDGHVMVTDGRYKLIHSVSTGDERLFDRIADPDEQDDLVGSVPEVKEAFDAALAEHFSLVEDHETERVNVEVTEDVRRQLQRLGYDE